MKTSTPMTKSPRAVAREALHLAQQALPPYSAVRSRKDYTQHQLFAILALKTFLKTDYRGVTQFLRDFTELRDDLGTPRLDAVDERREVGLRLRRTAQDEVDPEEKGRTLGLDQSEFPTSRTTAEHGVIGEPCPVPAKHERVAVDSRHREVALAGLIEAQDTTILKFAVGTAR